MYPGWGVGGLPTGIDTTYLYNEQCKPRSKDKDFRDLSTNIRSRSEHEEEDSNVLVILPPTNSPIISRWHESSVASMKPILMKRSRPQDCALTR